MPSAHLVAGRQRAAVRHRDDQVLVEEAVGDGAPHVHRPRVDRCPRSRTGRPESEETSRRPAPITTVPRSGRESTGAQTSRAGRSLGAAGARSKAEMAAVQAVVVGDVAATAQHQPPRGLARERVHHGVEVRGSTRADEGNAGEQCRRSSSRSPASPSCSQNARAAARVAPCVRGDDGALVPGHPERVARRASAAPPPRPRRAPLDGSGRPCALRACPSSTSTSQRPASAPSRPTACGRAGRTPSALST